LSVATIAVRLPAGLRAGAGGRPVVHLEVGDGITVAGVLDVLAVEHPDVERRVRDEQGRLRPHVNLFVDADHIRDLDGLTTELARGAELTILPAVSGGSAPVPAT
jgi:molybdopterin converting factor small subunit